MSSNLKNKLLIALPIFLGVGFIIWYMKKNSATAAPGVKKIGGTSSSSSKTTSSSSSSGSSVASVAAPAPTDFPLAIGSQNGSVKTLQGILGVDQDGVFGPDTQTALIALTGQSVVPSQSALNTIATMPNAGYAADYPLQMGSNNNSVKILQGILGVTQDGIFGSATQAALIAATGSSTVSSIAQLTALQNKNLTSISPSVVAATSVDWNALANPLGTNASS